MFFIFITFFLHNPIKYHFFEKFTAGIHVLSLNFEIIRIRNTAYDATLEEVKPWVKSCAINNNYVNYIDHNLS